MPTKPNVKPIPDGHHTVTPYLIVPGVAKLLEFLERAFDAKILHKMAQPDGVVRHAEVQIGNSRVMMGEAAPPWPALPCMIHLYVPDCDAVYQRALAAGATSVQPMTDQFYGDRSGGVKDPSGNQWWIATHIEDVSLEEMERRAQEYMAKGQKA